MINNPTHQLAYLMTIFLKNVIFRPANKTIQPGIDMKFVFLCDACYLKGDYANFVNNFPSNHELVKMTSDELLQNKGVDGAFAILVERSTWQKNFSVFRYFGLLPQLETVPMAVVGRQRRGEFLKGRSQNRNQEVFFNPAAAPEEIFLQLDKFISAPPAGFTYPRGSAKA